MPDLSWEKSRDVSPDVSAADAAAAREAAEAAEAAVEALDERGETEDLGADEAQQVRHAGWLARRRAEKLDRDATLADARRRLDELRAVGDSVEKLSKVVDKPLLGHLAALAAAADAARAAAASSDSFVRSTLGELRTLHVEDAGPMGPKSSSAYVSGSGHVTGPAASVRSRHVVVRTVSDDLENAIRFASTGHLAEAQDLVRAARQLAAPRPAGHYFRGPGGGVIALDDLTETYAQQVRKGVLVPLTDSERESFLKGEAG